MATNVYILDKRFIILWEHVLSVEFIDLIVIKYESNTQLFMLQLKRVLLQNVDIQSMNSIRDGLRVYWFIPGQ